MKNIQISPSILSADFSQLGSEIKRLEEGGADMIHVDVMDGHFVPNLTIGPPVIKALRKHCSLKFDVHLMISPVHKYIEAYADAGADIITIHRREDDRHINKKDVIKLKKKIFKPINLEMAANFDMLKFALKIKPKYVCIVPEKRKEITTEGGLNLKNKHLKNIVKKLQLANIDVSLFIDPTIDNIKKAIVLGANSIEIHTGKFARLIRLKNKKLYKKEFIRIFY